MLVREYRADDESACRVLFEELVDVHRMAYARLQLDLEPRDRRPGETLGGREFRV